MTMHDVQPESFSERLRSYRTVTGKTREELASDLGVTPITISRWETGSTKPSPLAAAKLRDHGFGEIAVSETNEASIPRIRQRSSSQTLEAQDGIAKVRLQTPNGPLVVVPSPFVRNGPPDQTQFHETLLRLQAATTQLDVGDLAQRLSMVESVETHGTPSQHRLERPRPKAVSWNSNYGTHGWHRYVGRFPPHLVRSLLNHFGAGPQSVVADPFCGSGTAAVECRLLGIPFVGIEICPLSCLIARTKAGFPLDPQLLSHLAARYRSYYTIAWSEFVSAHDASHLTIEAVLGRPGNPVPHFANIERWFSAEALLGVSITVQFGMELTGFERDAVLLALSAKMRSIGNVDVDVVRAEYRKQARQGVDVMQLVSRQLEKMAGDVTRAMKSHAGLLQPLPTVEIHEGSALEVDLGEQSVDHIVTSPPYGVEAISYLRTHLLSYRSLVAILKHDPYETREKTIGSEYVPKLAENSVTRASAVSSTCEQFFTQEADAIEPKYRQRQAAMLQFFDDLLCMGERMSCWLRPHGQIAFVVGNKKLGDRVIPTTEIVQELFSSAGLLLENEIRHKLKTNNSNSQVPWQDRIIQEESVMIFRKGP